MFQQSFWICNLVLRYLLKAEELYKEYKINQKVFYLGNTWLEFSCKEREDKLNKIDKQVTNLLINSKQKYHYLYARAVFFSPQLSRLGLRQRLQRQIIHFKQGRYKDLENIKNGQIF